MTFRDDFQVERKIGCVFDGYMITIKGTQHTLTVKEFNYLMTMMQAATIQGANPQHNLYTNEDPKKPPAILDRNGEVVLGLCKDCGMGEAELTQPCVNIPRHLRIND